MIKINVRHAAMFQQNSNRWFFVCVTNSQNNIPLFHKRFISHDPLQKTLSRFR